MKKHLYLKIAIQSIFLLFLLSQSVLALTVTSPSASDNWKNGEDRLIQWTNTSGCPVNIYLYNGNTRSLTIAQNYTSGNTYNWTVDRFASAGTNYRIQVFTQCGYGDEYGYSEYFEISGGTPSADLYSVSGRVSSNGSGLSGVAVTFNGVQKITLSDGSYAFYDMEEGTSGYISASKSGCTLSASIYVPPISFNVTGKDFTATCDDVTTTYYAISGQTREYDGTRVPFATVTFSGLSSVTSGSDGSYYKDVPDRWTGTVSASKSGYTFSGETFSTPVTSDKPGTNIFGEPDAYPLSGLSASERVRSTNWDTGYAYQQQEPCDQTERCVGDPVETSSGAQILKYTLLTVRGVIPVSFSLAYNSLVLDEGVAGRGWGFNFGFGAHLEPLSDGDVNVRWSSNRSNRFKADANGQFSSSEIACRFDKLIKNADNSFTLSREDRSIYEFSAAGQLTEIRNPRNQSLIFAYDGAGRLSRITEPVSGVFLNYAYNAQGLLESVTDPLNRQVRMGYDSNHDLVTITDADGHTSTHTYYDNGQIRTGMNAEGDRLFSNTYDDKGRVITQDDGIATNQLIRMSYDEESEPGRIITTVTNRNGDTRIFTYNEDSQMLSMKGELGEMIAIYIYDTNGKRISLKDANAHITRFGYDSNGNMTSVTDAAGNATYMSYDDNRNLIWRENTLGKRTSFTYDEQNNLKSSTDPQNNVVRYTYNDNGQTQTITRPGGGFTTYGYENGFPVRMTHPEGNIRTMGYDAAGRLIRSADAEGNAHTFTYDESCGGSCRAESVTDPLGNTVRKTYDSRGNLLTLTDARGKLTQYAYDGNGRLVSRTDALNNETRYEYDGEDRLVKTTDARGNTTQMAYDAKGRLIRVTDALGNTRQMTYDATYNVRTRTDASGNTVMSLDYDALDNLVSVTDALERKTTSEYDELSRLIRTTDSLNRTTHFNYDDLDRLVSAIDALSGKSEQGFDKDGNLTGITDPNSNQTGFSFDKNGRLTAETSTTGTSVRHTYNAKDLLAEVRNARGQNRMFEYDAAGRLTRMTDPDGAVSYTYDANNNVLTVTDESGTITREYDDLNRVTTYTDTRGNTIRYAYDEVGNLTALTYPDGGQVTYAYDALDRLITVTVCEAEKTHYGYDENSRLIRMERPNGTVMTRTYDKAGQLIQQKDVTSKGEIIVQYDFTYDAAGNITEESVIPKPEPFPFTRVSMTYGDANRLATYNGESVTHDADGNMTRGPLNGSMADFEFDSRNRLVRAGTTTYAYNAENHRIAMTENGKKTRYIVNPNASLSQVLARIEADGTHTFYVYGLGLIAKRQGYSYLNYHFDLRGSTVAITDESGHIIDRFQYAPYGGLVNHTGSTSTPFLYNGRDGVMTDGNSLYYMRARYYNPKPRRFVNQDLLLGDVNKGQTLNRYMYVTGSPVIYTDPFGLRHIYSSYANPYVVNDYSSYSKYGPIVYGYFGSYPRGNLQEIGVDQNDAQIIVKYEYGSARYPVAVSGETGVNNIASGYVVNTHLGAIGPYEEYPESWQDDNNNPFGPAMIELNDTMGGRHIHGTNGPEDGGINYIGGEPIYSRKFTLGCARNINEVIYDLKFDVDETLKNGIQIPVSFY